MTADIIVFSRNRPARFGDAEMATFHRWERYTASQGWNSEFVEASGGKLLLSIISPRRPPVGQGSSPMALLHRSGYSVTPSVTGRWVTEAGTAGSTRTFDKLEDALEAICPTGGET